MALDRDWKRVRALFEAAAVRPPAERTAFLDALPPADRLFRRRVEQMLEADADASGFLEPVANPDAAPGLVGRRIGGFRIVRPLATGGMGTVWEAEQDEPRRKVAIKTMHVGSSSERARRRFRFEAELLAQLRHPAIAQVYGAGVLEGGDDTPSVPWFALEFVEAARSLCGYAVDEQLDLPARLRLFQTVCEAVHYAHQRGVIHRDLKSANVLVDRDGHVKVIDFGIARVIDGDRPPQTLAGEIVGTLESMSPEQVEGLSDRIDARTDVYALGVILYELATDTRPHRLAGLPLSEASRRIREVEPTLPTRIVRDLPREIDWIVATAMAKEPERRYPAASDLVAEVDRLLAGRAVEACTPSRTYHLRKFCRRHRVAVTASLVGCVAIVGGIGFGWLRERDAQAAEAATRAEAKLTDRFGRFIGDLFDGMTAEHADGRVITREAILERGTRWLRDELADRPVLQAKLLNSVGGVRSSYGDFAGAQAVLQEAVALARAAGPDGEGALAQGLVYLGQVHRRQNAPQPAEAALREALAIWQRRRGKDALALGPVLCELGLVLAPTRPGDAVALQRRAYDLEVRHNGADSGNAAVLLGNLGMLEYRARRFAEAKDAFERALPVLVAEHGESDPRVAVMFGNLAAACQRLGDLDAALRFQQRELAVAERATPGHPRVGMSLIGMAQLSEATGEPKRALEFAERAVEILSGSLRPDHVQVLAAENARARLWLRAGQRGRARAALEEVARLTPQAGEARLAQHSSRTVLAELERLDGNSAQALEIIDRILADPLTEKEPPVRAQALWVRAFVHAQSGDGERAAQARADALKLVPQGQAFSDAKFAVLQQEPERAIEILEAAIRDGYQNATLLHDPEFVELRRRPDFAPIAAALKRRAGD